MKLLLALAVGFSAFSAADQMSFVKKKQDQAPAAAAVRREYGCRNLYSGVPRCGPEVKTGKCLEGAELMIVDGKSKYSSDNFCKAQGRDVLCRPVYMVAECAPQGDPDEACFDAKTRDVRTGSGPVASNCSPTKTDKD